MAVLYHHPVLSLVGGLDFGDGEHDHVVVVAVTDQLVPASLLADGGALTQQVMYLTLRTRIFQTDLEHCRYQTISIMSYYLLSELYL